MLYEQTKEIILASGSENRRQALARLGIPFRVVQSHFDEDSIMDEDLYARVQKIAQGKARDVARSHKGLIISADTFTVFHNTPYQKPRDVADARKMLKNFSGQTGKSITGICILDTARMKEVITYRETVVTCKPLTEDEIEKYIHSKPVTDWAAAYNPLDRDSSQIFSPQDGYRFGLEYGLPLDVVVYALARIGIPVDQLEIAWIFAEGESLILTKD